ncbi:MAG: aminoglycoside adenylyltransferase domain-containing protein [Streptosporangiaceae bacterium]
MTRVAGRRLPDPGPPAEVVDYARVAAARLAERAGPALLAAYLHGSAVLGGWTAARSDVDLLFVMEDNAAPADLAAIGAALSDAGPGPGRGLESSAVTASQVARPASPWPFIWHARSAAVARIQVIAGAGSVGDPDLLMHYAVARAAGLAVLGPPPAAVIGPVPRPVILGYLADELGWGLANAAECYAVLNACRALAFLADGQIVSKVAGGRAVLASGSAPADLVGRSLDQQRGAVPERAAAPDAIRYVTGVIRALRAAAASEQREPGGRPW